jgi:hypothetical protein
VYLTVSQALNRSTSSLSMDATAQLTGVSHSLTGTPPKYLSFQRGRDQCISQSHAHSTEVPLLSACNVRGRGSLSHYLVYSESPSRWCSLAIILLIYLHHNLLFVSNRSIQNTYRLVTLAVLTLLSLSCSLERFAFVYHVNISKTRYTVTPEFHHHVRNRENGHTWFDCTPENRV